MRLQRELGRHRFSHSSQVGFSFHLENRPWLSSQMGITVLEGDGLAVLARCFLSHSFVFGLLEVSGASFITLSFRKTTSDEGASCS